MNLNQIKEELLRAAALVEDFGVNHLEIDRDAALNKIRQAYESLRFMSVEQLCKEEPAPYVMPTPEEAEPEVEVEFILPPSTEEEDIVLEDEPTEPEVESEVEVEPEPVVEAEPEPEPESEPEPVVEVEEDFDIDEAFEPEEDEPEAEPEPIVEPESEVVSEPEPEVKKVVVEPSLFGDYEPIVKRSTPSRRKIMALYEDEPAPAPKVEPKVEPTPAPVAESAPVAEPEPTPAPAPAPVAEPKVEPIVDSENKVLGEVITPTTTIADTITPVVSVAEDRPVETLRGAISVVDRFMLIRDLFDDDAALYEQTMDELEKMDNLDDCIIYIAENFAWRPSSEGAKLMMDLLQRKLG